MSDPTGLPGPRRTRLFARVDELLDAVGIPRSLAEAGVGGEEFEAALPDLVKLERLLADRPRTGLRQILDAVIEDIRARREASAFGRSEVAS